MNGRKARELRREAISKNDHRRLKRKAHADQGQHPKFKPERRRRNHVGHAPTWPATDDQRAQSRPLIVVHPIRQMCAGLNDHDTIRRLRGLGWAPKHRLDAGAVAKYDELGGSAP